MSTFPRIDPNHPLTKAAREVNEQAEELGLAKTLELLNMGVTPGELMYLAEQRAYRAVAAAVLGVNLGTGPEAEEIVRAILRTPLWKEFSLLLVSTHADGMAIGWKGRENALTRSS